jgi:Flp pilus assembly protein TadB
VTEDKQERLNRELIELLNELRVALPGVQVLFAFLLTVPFAQRFSTVNSTQRNIYFVSVLCTAAATAFLIAPTSYHRLQFRSRDKERMLQTSNLLAIVGMFFLAVAVTLVLFVITDVLFGTPWSSIVAVVAGLLFALLWYGLPLARRMRENGSDEES